MGRSLTTDLKAPLRLRATYTSDSTNYPYDTQFTELQIQSRDYSGVFIELNTKSMNKAYGLPENAKELEPTDKLDVMQNELFAPRRVSQWFPRQANIVDRLSVIVNIET